MGLQGERQGQAVLVELEDGDAYDQKTLPKILKELTLKREKKMKGNHELLGY